jgi:hypothetical protein
MYRWLLSLEHFGIPLTGSDEGNISPCSLGRKEETETRTWSSAQKEAGSVVFWASRSCMASDFEGAASYETEGDLCESWQFEAFDRWLFDC